MSYALGTPTDMCQWEKFLLAENISEQDIKNNPKVLKFISKNADKFYVPTKVLKMYGFDFEL
jgi:hypothetical protein